MVCGGDDRGLGLCSEVVGGGVWGVVAVVVCGGAVCVLVVVAVCCGDGGDRGECSAWRCVAACPAAREGGG